MTKRKRNIDELREASNHLRYEFDMLMLTARTMFSGVLGQGALNNATLESFVIHVRNLIYFLYAAKPKQDHVIADDYFDSSDEWTNVRLQKSQDLQKAENRSNKEVTHLSYDRIKITKKMKQWTYVDIANEIAKAFNVFLDKVDKAKLGKEWFLEKLIDYEKEIRYQDPPPNGEREYSVLIGSIPVLISAPHGAVHSRMKDEKLTLKEEDEYTSSLAILLGELTGSHVIYARRKSDTDPNSAGDSKYKDEIKAICSEQKIKFVIDLHGMNKDRETALQLGTNNGTSCPEQLPILETVLNRHQFSRNAEDHLQRYTAEGTFQGSGNGTINYFVSQSLKIPSIQIEIIAQNRIPIRRNDATLYLKSKEEFRGNSIGIRKTIDALHDFVDEVNERFI